MNTEAAALLDDLGRLRSRTRQDSHGYWLPLLLFGVLILVAPVLYGAAAIAVPTDGSSITDPFGPELHIGGVYFEPLSLFTSFQLNTSPLAVGFYWLGVAVVGTLVTLGWYRWRALRVGVQPRTGTYLLYALGGLLVCVLPVPLVASLLISALGGSDKASVLLSVAVLVVGIALTALCARGRRSVVKVGRAGDRRGARADRDQRRHLPGQHARLRWSVRDRHRPVGARVDGTQQAVCHGGPAVHRRRSAG